MRKIDLNSITPENIDSNLILIYLGQIQAKASILTHCVKDMGLDENGLKRWEELKKNVERVDELLLDLDPK